MLSEIFYVSEGKLFKAADGRCAAVYTESIEKYREKVKEIARNREWKTQGVGAMFMGAHAANDGTAYTAVAAAERMGDRLIYAANMDQSCGVYSLEACDIARAEGCLMRRPSARVQQVSFDGRDTLAMSISDGPLEWHLALCNQDGSDFRIITEGECIDLCARFSLKSPHLLYYSSAGIHRGERQVAFGSHVLNCLDIKSGEINELMADLKWNYVNPREDREGALYCIRRPNKNIAPGFSALDFVLMPWRLLKAIFGFLSLFTMRYSGEPLSKRRGLGANPAKQPDADPSARLIESNIEEAEKILKENQARGALYPGTTPGNWELMRLDGRGGAEVIEKGVMDYTFDDQNQLVYSNGKYLLRRTHAGTTEIVCEAKGAGNIVIF